MPDSTRALPGLALVAAAVASLAGGIRLLIAGRTPDGALAFGLAVALGTVGATWLLIERRRALTRQRRATQITQ